MWYVRSPKKVVLLVVSDEASARVARNVTLRAVNSTFVHASLYDRGQNGAGESIASLSILLALSVIKIK